MHPLGDSRVAWPVAMQVSCVSRQTVVHPISGIPSMSIGSKTKALLCMCPLPTTGRGIIAFGLKSKQPLGHMGPLAIPYVPRSMQGVNEFPYPIFPTAAV